MTIIKRGYAWDWMKWADLKVTSRNSTEIIRKLWNLNTAGIEQFSG
jgi:hypothetical protein